VTGAQVDVVGDVYSETLQQLLVGGGTSEQEIVLPERLDRARLDFSHDSLHRIDDYLNDVHDSGDTAVGMSLLTTIWAAALYVGEVIRRLAPQRLYQWIRLSDDAPEASAATTGQFDIGSVHALRGRDGELCLPSRAVLRVVLRGRKARSIHSFASGAIEADAEFDPPPPPVGNHASRSETLSA
jgi:hypothetical protein